MAKGRNGRVGQDAPAVPVSPPSPPRRGSLRTILIAAAAIAGIAAIALVVWRVIPSGVPAVPLNILLVTLDTTRADHLGSYGWKRARTGEMDRLASEGVRFDKAFSPVPITLPAHTSLLTGLYPFATGVRNNGNFYLSDKVETIATVLRARGYRTAAFLSSFVLDRRYGLGRGFETYDDRMDAQSEGGGAPDVEVERRGDKTAAALDAWLTSYAQQKSAPFFAWLHLYDPHAPYAAPPPFREEFADAPYDGEIAFCDAIVGQLVERLGELGLVDRTLVAITGDHGEGLGDHGEETHTMFVYDSVIHVPLILWRPHVLPAGMVIGQPVRLTDLAPTLLDLVGAPALPTSHGQSLRPLIEGRGRAATPELYAETLMPELYMNWAPLRSIRDERWKYIEAPKPELYDLASDPAESHNVHDERPQTVRGLRQALGQLTGGQTGALNVGTVDHETLEKLAALGYVGAGSSPAPATADELARRPDPKDMIGVFNVLRRMPAAVRARRFSEALPVLRAALSKDPRNSFAQSLLANCYRQMGDFHEAIAQYRKYLELVPSSANAHALIAQCYARLGDRQNAIREADAALAIDPKFADARVLKADALASGGDVPGALVELRAAVASDPAKPRFRFELAKVLGDSGQTAAAETEFQAALELQPTYAPALAGLGTLYARQGKHEQAARALERAVAAAPQHDEARYNLATVYEQLGRIADARAQYQRLVEAPGTNPAVSAAARNQLARLGMR